MSRNHESVVVVVEERRTELLLTNTSHAISDMIQNDDFCIMSQVAVASNALDVDNDVELNEVLEDDSGDEDNEDQHTQGQETPHVHTG
ncbi:hypothetical protein OROGR_006559 [Orobanche gracilis]